MSSVAVVGCDRSRPAVLSEPGGAGLRPLERGVMFDRCGANLGRPHRVKIEREPVALDNVLIRCGAFDAVLEPICCAGEEGWITGIERAIDRRCFAAPLLGCLGKGPGVVKASTDSS